MKRSIVLALVAVFLLPLPAHAESYVSAPEMPKGMDGGIRCIGEASADGHSLRMVMYFGANGDVERERAWQASRCEAKMRRAVVAWAAAEYDGRYCLKWNPNSRIAGHNEDPNLYCYKKPAMTVVPSDVKITVERL